MSFAFWCSRCKVDHAGACGPGPCPSGDPGPVGPPGADASPIDPECLEAEYAQLPLEELKMHFLAAKNALIDAMGKDP